MKHTHLPDFFDQEAQDFASVVSPDLNLCGYFYKWRKAIELTEGDWHTFDFWMQVRQRFLELGGQYIVVREEH